jgi:secreted Zn-dependent insulinase-like peptidase
MVVQRFSAIANYDSEVEIHGSQLISEKKLPLIIEVEPLKELREISISFQLPKMKPYWTIKPAQYLAALIGHEGRGSLLQLLKDKGWAESLSAGAGLEDRSSSLFSIDIGLTPEGYKQRQQLTRLVFAWIDAVRSNGIEAWRYDERASLAAMAFRFQEKQNPMGYVSSLASLMHQYPPADVLRAGYVMESYDQQLIDEVAGRLIPENCFIMLTAPEVTTDRVSKRYQVPYRVTAIDAAEVEQWLNPEPVATLALSPKNPYIPASLELLAGPETDLPAPLSNAQGLVSWHMPDSRFGVPKASIMASLGTDKTQTIEGLAMAELYLDIVRDQLNASSYPATEAGLNFGLGASARGLAVNVAGYSDRQPVLLRDVLDALKQPDWNQSRFDQLKQKRLRQLANFQREYPFRQVISGLYSMLTGRWTPLQKAPVIEAVTMDQVQRFASSLLASMELKLLISGNHNRQVAEDIQRMFTQSFTLEQIDNPGRIAKLSAGAVQGQVPVDHEDAVSMLYFQATDDSLQQRAATSLVAEMLSAPFYNSLRTEKQLGYVVSAFASHQGPVPGLIMLVQSPVADEQQLRAEFEGFIIDYAKTVAELSAEDLSRYQDSLLSSLEEKPKNLSEMNGRFMESLALGYRDFDFRAQMGAAIRQVDVATLQRAYQELLVDQRRVVWVSTTKLGQVNSAVDLRENSAIYSYDF